MGTIKFYFSNNAPKRKGVLSMCAYLGKGTDGKPKRNYRTITTLINPNYKYWDKKEQRFMEGTETAMHNNKVLKDLENLAVEVAKVEFSDTIKFLDMVETGITPNVVTTLGDMVEECIKEQKETATKNYQLYITLLNNLKGENHKSIKGNVRTFNKPTYNGLALIDTPIKDISTPHLKAFAKWVKTEKKGANYRNLNTTLKHVIKVACETGLNPYKIEYNFSKDKPKRIVKNPNEQEVLTIEQVKKISGIKPNGRFPKLEQLYIDMALLMYHTFSRPADVLSFHSDMIRKTDKGNIVIDYIPSKKRNYEGNESTTLLNDFALSIINKYKNQSKGGYFLPFKMNNLKWDIEGNFERWNTERSKTLMRVNTYLKKVGEKIGLNFPLTLYTFRRSAISHAVNAKILSPGEIAKRAGTSIEMISKHYYKDCDL